MEPVWAKFGECSEDQYPVAEMGSSGHWHSPVVRVHGILGRRAMRTRRMTQADVQGQMAKLSRHLRGKSPPSAQAIRDWETANPNYPEWAVRNGLVTKDQLLPWALEMLSGQGPEVTMGQSLASAASSEDLPLGEALVKGAILLGGLYIAGEILNAFFGPRNDESTAVRVNESEVRPLPRRMGRIRRRHHRPYEGGTIRPIGLPPGHY